jgi:hypothetical protein
VLTASTHDEPELARAKSIVCSRAEALVWPAASDPQGILGRSGYTARVNESTDELRALYLGLDAEYREAGDQLKTLLADRGLQAKSEVEALLARLRKLQGELDHVQAKLRDRLAQEGR